MFKARSSGQRGAVAGAGVLRRRGAGLSTAAQVARWTFDDTSAGYVDQIDGRVLTPGGTVALESGIIGNAASFGGAGWLETPSVAAYLPAVGTAYELWVRPDTITGGYQTLIGQDEGGSTRNLVIYQVNDLVEVYLFNNAGGFVGANSGPVVFAPGAWTHMVAVIADAQALRVYANGALIMDAGALGGTINAGAYPLALGAQKTTGPQTALFAGRLDAPAVWQFGAAGDPGAAFWLARYNSVVNPLP